MVHEKQCSQIPSKKEQAKRLKKKDELACKKKKDETSDSDNDNSYYSETEDSEEEGEMDTMEYRKFLAKIFPSKYLDKKIVIINI
jgi:hypothetical protein